MLYYNIMVLYNYMEQSSWKIYFIVGLVKMTIIFQILTLTKSHFLDLCKIKNVSCYIKTLIT